MRVVRSFMLAVAAILFPGIALAQSTCPAIITGAVLTAGQWQACFIAKQDALGYTPLNRAGGTMTGELILPAATTAGASMRIPHGAAPTSPVNGDIWTTTSGIYVRINGTTQGPISGVTPSALTKVDDTNVTLTLGGTPTTALLQATSITAGWTGSLAVARGGTGGTTQNTAALGLGSWYILGASAVAVSHTGDTNETTLVTITVPAGTLGANGIVRITEQWTFTSAGSGAIARTKFNGTTYQALNPSTLGSYRTEVQFANRNATNSQVATSATTQSVSTGFQTSAGASATSAHDTTGALNITITVQLTAGGETATLESYVVEIVPRS